MEIDIKNNLEQYKLLVDDDFKELDSIIKHNISTSNPLTNIISQHLFSSQGKRIRTLLLFLSAKCFNYQGNQHTKIAAILEMFHSSSLLHDDVIDNSYLRRGKKSANSIWGNKACILVGDYLFAQAFDLIIQTNNPSISKLFTQIAKDMTYGEIKQLQHGYSLELSEIDYYSIIENKTAILFSGATQIGPILTNHDREYIEVMSYFGKELGIGFQIIDDLLDYKAEEDKLGKNTGDDFFEGKVTLPIIHAYKHGTSLQKSTIENAFNKRSKNCFEETRSILDETKSIDYCHTIAKNAIDKAATRLLLLDSTEYLESLAEIAYLTYMRKL